MNFCSHCGQPVHFKIPEGDDRQRHVCSACNTIHYINPRIVTGCLPTYEGRVLLCRRAIEPRYGFWTLPAGFMENGETTEQGAARECWEEANANVRIGELYTMTSIPTINQVHLFYHAELIEPTFACGPESLEVELFEEDQIPWNELSFTAVKFTLKRYFEDRRNNHFPLHSGFASSSPDGHWHWTPHDTEK
ncbi:NUDIX hydrolase [Porticoccaceae bacterium LTM1]|nr:NUDIX hydrolase [Porticoccaceae bacterium LTM1]